MAVAGHFLMARSSQARARKSSVSAFMAHEVAASGYTKKHNELNRAELSRWQQTVHPIQQAHSD